MYFENECRDFVEERGLDLVVYTGTHGVCQLPDVNGDLVDIFLYSGSRLPVPRFYWKILHDPQAGAGVAVVGVNNPHLSSLPSDYTICPPVEVVNSSPNRSDRPHCCRTTPCWPPSTILTTWCGASSGPAGWRTSLQWSTTCRSSRPWIFFSELLRREG